MCVCVYFHPRQGLWLCSSITLHLIALRQGLSLFSYRQAPTPLLSTPPPHPTSWLQYWDYTGNPGHARLCKWVSGIPVQVVLFAPSCLPRLPLLLLLNKPEHQWLGQLGKHVSQAGPRYTAGITQCLSGCEEPALTNSGFRWQRQFLSLAADRDFIYVLAEGNTLQMS